MKMLCGAKYTVTYLAIESQIKRKGKTNQYNDVYHLDEAREPGKVQLRVLSAKGSQQQRILLTPLCIRMIN